MDSGLWLQLAHPTRWLGLPAFRILMDRSSLVQATTSTIAQGRPVPLGPGLARPPQLPVSRRSLANGVSGVSRRGGDLFPCTGPGSVCLLSLGRPQRERVRFYYRSDQHNSQSYRGVVAQFSPFAGLLPGHKFYLVIRGDRRPHHVGREHRGIEQASGQNQPYRSA